MALDRGVFAFRGYTRRFISDLILANVGDKAGNFCTNEAGNASLFFEVRTILGNVRFSRDARPKISNAVPYARFLLAN